MKQHYGASGFVGNKVVSDEVAEDYRVAVVKYCRERDLNFTLGTMLEMARFAQHMCSRIDARKRCIAQVEAAAARIVRHVIEQNVDSLDSELEEQTHVQNEILSILNRVFTK